MRSFGLITAIMPVLLWFGLFLYLLRVDKKLKAVTTQVAESRNAPAEAAKLTVRPVDRQPEPDQPSNR